MKIPFPDYVDAGGVSIYAPTMIVSELAAELRRHNCALPVYLDFIGTVRALVSIEADILTLEEETGALPILTLVAGETTQPMTVAEVLSRLLESDPESLVYLESAEESVLRMTRLVEVQDGVSEASVVIGPLEKYEPIS